MAKESISKTNAARLLDQMGIQYELRAYEVDPEDLAAETVAAKIGMPAEQVFKTLLARGDRNGPVMAVIPGDQELDLKALAVAAGEKNVQLVRGEGAARAHRIHSRRGDGFGSEAGVSGFCR